MRLYALMIYLSLSIILLVGCGSSNKGTRLAVETPRTFTPTKTPIPQIKTLPTRTPRPKIQPYITTIDGNVNIRSGPGTDFNIVGKVRPGDEFNVVGKIRDESWFKLDDSGWVAAWVVGFHNPDNVSIPIVQAEIQSAANPPLPATEPTPTPPQGCPDGCLARSPGCEIKGNISFTSGEKIYHLPGDDYYSETEINSQNGERWFCAAQEAESNGWRHTFR